MISPSLLGFLFPPSLCADVPLPQEKTPVCRRSPPSGKNLACVQTSPLPIFPDGGDVCTQAGFHPFLNFLNPLMILHLTFQPNSHGLQGLMGYPKQRMVVLCRQRRTGPQAGGLKILKIKILELLNQKVIIWIQKWESMLIGHSA